MVPGLCYHQFDAFSPFLHHWFPFRLNLCKALFFRPVSCCVPSSSLHRRPQRASVNALFGCKHVVSFRPRCHFLLASRIDSNGSSHLAAFGLLAPPPPLAGASCSPRPASHRLFCVRGVSSCMVFAALAEQNDPCYLFPRRCRFCRCMKLSTRVVEVYKTPTRLSKQSLLSSCFLSIPSTLLSLTGFLWQAFVLLSFLSFLFLFTPCL